MYLKDPKIVERVEGDERLGVAGLLVALFDEAEVLEERQVSNPDGEAALEQNLSQSPITQPPYIVNSGTFISHLDLLAIGVNLHF